MTQRSVVKSFHITPDSPYVCIGPLDQAFLASKKLQQQEYPTCWSRTASSQFPTGSTVLVHDVDMRLPVVSGTWYVGRLFNPYGVMCGVMCWQAKINEMQEELQYAARLIHRMEDLGASVICNEENDAVRQEGIRFIGRYSWELPRTQKQNTVDSEGDEEEEEEFEDDEDDDLPEGIDDCYEVFRGPVCFFATPESMQTAVLPQVQEYQLRIQQEIKNLVDAKLEEIHARGEDADPEDIYYEILHHEEHGEKFAYPAIANYGDNGGISMTFANQEYLYGRVWLNESQQCHAFCCYTYATPDCFGQCRVETEPICPFMPEISPEVFKESQNNYPRLLCEILQERSDEEIQQCFAHMTLVMKKYCLREAMMAVPTLVKRMLQHHLLHWDVDTFNCMFYYGTGMVVDVELILLLLESIDDSLLQQIIEMEQARFQRVHQALLHGTYDFQSKTSYEDQKPCHVAHYIESLDIVAALIRRKHPVNGVLGQTPYNGWFMTPLTYAASQGLVQSVELLLDAGANVDEVVGNDHWNALVYAAFSNSEECLKLFKTRFPTHETWSREDIPVNPKEFPEEKFSFGIEVEEEEEVEDLETGSEASQEVGDINTLISIWKERYW